MRSTVENEISQCSLQMFQQNASVLAFGITITTEILNTVSKSSHVSQHRGELSIVMVSMKLLKVLCTLLWRQNIRIHHPPVIWKEDEGLWDLSIHCWSVICYANVLYRDTEESMVLCWCIACWHRKPDLSLNQAHFSHFSINLWQIAYPRVSAGVNEDSQTITVTC